MPVLKTTTNSKGRWNKNFNFADVILAKMIWNTNFENNGIVSVGPPSLALQYGGQKSVQEVKNEE